VNFFERRNLGIPVTLFVLLSYLMGYWFSNNLNGLFVAIVFAVIVFVFDIDNRIKIAVKQSYFFGILFMIIYLILNILQQLITINNNWSVLKLSGISKLYQLILAGLNIIVILVYLLFMIAAILNNDIRINAILKLFKEEQIQSDQQNESQQSVPSSQNKNHSKVNKLFPPNQQQYPPMPQVKPPAKPEKGNKSTKVVSSQITEDQSTTQQTNVQQDSAQQAKDMEPTLEQPIEPTPEQSIEPTPDQPI